MAKQKIYAIGSTIELANLPWLIKKINPYTAIVPQLEINKDLLIPGITSKMDFYPDLDIALIKAEGKAKDYDKDYYHDFPPVFLVEIEDAKHNQSFRVTNILKAYVIKKKNEAVTECEINISAEKALEKNNCVLSSLFSASANIDPQIICTKNNYFGDFSKLQLNKQRWTLCNIHFFGAKEGRGGADNHAAKLPKEILKNIGEYVARSPLKLS